MSFKGIFFVVVVFFFFFFFFFFFVVFLLLLLFFCCCFFFFFFFFFFPISRSSNHFIQHSRTILAILVKGHKRIIDVTLF